MDLTRIQLITKEKNQPIKTSAAGFPPYTRGNRADGYLLELPKIKQTDSTEDRYLFDYKGNINWNSVVSTMQQIWNDYRDGKIKNPTLLCIISEDISLHWIALIRALRLCWSSMNQSKIKVFQPLQIEVQTPFGYHSSLLKILSAEVDAIISNELTEEILKDFIEDFKLLKTIDPFGGSAFIEEKTTLYAQKILREIIL